MFDLWVAPDFIKSMCAAGITFTRGVKATGAGLGAAGGRCMHVGWLLLMHEREKAGSRGGLLADEWLQRHPRRGPIDGDMQIVPSRFAFDVDVKVA